jgi:hypothetical protein
MINGNNICTYSPVTSAVFSAAFPFLEVFLLFLRVLAGFGDFGGFGGMILILPVPLVFFAAVEGSATFLVIEGYTASVELPVAVRREGVASLVVTALFWITGGEGESRIVIRMCAGSEAGAGGGEELVILIGVEGGAGAGAGAGETSFVSAGAAARSREAVD